MELSKERVAYLLEAFTSQKATSQEEKELMEWMHEAQEDAELMDFVKELWEKYQPGQHRSDVNWDVMFDRIVSGAQVVSIVPQPKRMRTWWPHIAVAAVLFFLLAGAYFFFFNRSSGPTLANKNEQPHDVKPPETNRATIKLSNGQTVYLDSVANGLLVRQNNVKVVKLADGKIAYSGSTAEVIYNELFNPRGSKVVDMVLSDGSHVWLNAGSSIRFPVAFAGNERKVSITGEAYFEIAHNPGMPFKVVKGETAITVLGTHFNVNGYEDETEIKVTLLEGKVKVSRGSETEDLKPGQQARVGDKIAISGDVDMEKVMAWKNGRFVFEMADIESIMRQLARWYDLDVKYEGKITSQFGGSISRQVNLSEIFKILEATGSIKCKVEGRAVTVQPGGF